MVSVYRCRCLNLSLLESLFHTFKLLLMVANCFDFFPPSFHTNHLQTRLVVHPIVVSLRSKIYDKCLSDGSASGCCTVAKGLSGSGQKSHASLSIPFFFNRIAITPKHVLSLLSLHPLFSPPRLFELRFRLFRLLLSGFFVYFRICLGVSSRV